MPPLSKPNLLSSEVKSRALLTPQSQQELDSFPDPMMEHIRPTGAIEESLANDVTDATWHLICHETAASRAWSS